MFFFSFTNGVFSYLDVIIVYNTTIFYLNLLAIYYIPTLFVLFNGAVSIKIGKSMQPINKKPQTKLSSLLKFWK